MGDQKYLNFLYIFADQLQPFRIGCMGGSVATPNLDALACDGVLFKNAYSDSPVCTPFRGCLMTGQYPTESGIHGNEQGPKFDAETLPRTLNKRGYTTSYVGKWHLHATGNCPIAPEQRAGFQRFIGYQAYNSFWEDVCFYDEVGKEHRFDEHRTKVTADIAIERLNEIRDNRFLHMVSFQTPHYPMQPSPEFEARYAEREPGKRGNMQEPKQVHTPTFSPFSPRPIERDPDYHRAGKCLDDFLRCYDAMITEFDFHVGRIIRELKRLGLYDRTVIVVTADHGDMAGSHGLMNKAVAYEESARVPLITRSPQGLRNAVIETPVSAGVDTLPTFIDYAEMAIPNHASGHSWKKLCDGEITTRTEPVFSEFIPRNWCMVRKGNLKYVAERDTLTPQHLWDLEKDPLEMNDLCGNAAMADTQKELAQLLENWQKGMVAA